MIENDVIPQYENRLFQAVKAGDVAALDELLHDNLLFNIPTGETCTKEMDLDNYRSGRMKVHDIIASDRIIRTTGDLSTVAVTVDLKATFDGQPIDGTYRYLRVWMWCDQSWKIIAGSVSPLPQ